ncbi:hypothetical protein BU16DRAFT_551412 [Lophium mytilinum]|uniref:Inosine/uridine-preferring nucleoside hydrolase domain-containing protein n=1 Tax=Lophium mytilinum TaxID=390894 RepID=A0A6A6QNC0_9PEZI|nr:hypothetical protein BU16DRAFT_551412 [Lophium mytilinum]
MPLPFHAYGLSPRLSQHASQTPQNHPLRHSCIAAPVNLLVSTLPNVNLLAVNVNTQSSYSALAISAIISHYGHTDVPVGLLRPITNESFFDDWLYERGEFASKAWDSVALYRKTLAAQRIGSVTIASIGFFDNLSGLLNSTADAHSPLPGPALMRAKVSKLVIVGGQYPSGSEYNFYSFNPLSTALVVNTWPGPMTFSGAELNVTAGAALTREGPATDPVAAAYRWHIGYNTSRATWDPFAVLYACQGLGTLFEYEGAGGRNYVYPNVSNEWVYGVEKQQRWLKLKASNVTAANELERLYLKGARMWG